MPKATLLRNCLPGEEGPRQGHATWFFVLLLIGCILLPSPVMAGKTVRIGVLLAADTRLDTLDGFQAEMAEHAARNKATLNYEVHNAGGDQTRLNALAEALIAARPDIAIAGGGIEADALKLASAGSSIPVVFLAVSSAVERGLVASMQAPGGNLTGVDTNDTRLLEKRLWYLRKLLPDARRVLCFNVPGITPSVTSVALAREVAPGLGLEIVVVDVASQEEIALAATAVRRSDVDVILLLPVAPTDLAMKDILLPLSRREKIPIMGYNEQSLERGAFASYGGSRRACGAQAAKLAIKVLHGTAPAKLPVETPTRLELAINRRMVEELGLTLSSRVWRLADTVLDLNP